ncbi:aprataxin [Orussus abietinus]|uniref:aprataxin n=1 Tax=Orussus abietinus TaxID=222816 RepID=UPI0006267DA3|nr:aprataxin [Orussus abietinus]
MSFIREGVKYRSAMRKVSRTGRGGSSSSAKKGHWSQGLLTSMEDPDSKVKEDESVIVIRDKYPKARFHYLVLPKRDIPGISSLTADDRSLLEHMEKVGLELTKDQPNCEFKVGYHAVPSMQRLHLHVISTDFDSPCLKTKQHWNSFTTPFFLPSRDVREQLQRDGAVTKMSREESDKYLKTSLKCHKCSATPKNIPELKRHLLSHIDD